MEKRLVLANDSYKQPTNEELMASGKSAIDKHMEILRDEMRSVGMKDGSEMEAIISQKQEESMTELRSEIYGNEVESNSFEEAGGFMGTDFEAVEGMDNEMEGNLFEEASSFARTDFKSAEGLENEVERNSFEEASVTDETTLSVSSDREILPSESRYVSLSDSIEQSR